MIKRTTMLGVSLAMLALAPPASASDPSPAARSAPDGISYRGIGNGWTGGRTDWSIDRKGRGRYETTERGQRISKRLDVGVEGFDRLRRILEPLESIDEMPCEGGGLTDQAHGGLSWRRGKEARSLEIDFGCARGNGSDAWARFGDANALLLEWTARSD